MSNPATDEETVGQQQRTPSRGRRWLWAGAAIAIAIVGVAAFLLTQDDRRESDALATVAGYFEAFNNGDVEGTLAFLDTDGEYIVTTDPDTPFATSGYDETVGLLAWSVASDTIIRDEECTPNDAPEGDIEVTCTFLIDVIHRKVTDLPGLPTSLTVSVSDDRFIDFNEAITIPLVGGSPIDSYVEWLSENHPEEVELALQVVWPTVEEAVAAGEARARYIDEWAASLDG